MGEVQWSEFDIIDRFFRGIGNPSAGDVITGIGDDAAVLPGPAGRSLLVTHDMMVEDVHYEARWMSPFQLARKLVKVNVSDIAAMGGNPTHALLSLALPDPLKKGWLEDFSRGLKETLEAFRVTLVGGDTSRSPGPVMAALTLLGTCPAGQPVPRHHPDPGDTLYVSGTLGDAAAGLLLLKNRGTSASETEDEAFLAARHLDPPPRPALGEFIASRGLATAMIDISDGLLADLEHLLEGTSLGAEIQVEALPLSDPLQRIAPRLRQEPEVLALTGGEDYELLFASPVPPGAFPASPPAPLTPIGRVVASPGIRVLKDGTPLPLDTRGFRHLFHEKG